MIKEANVTVIVTDMKRAIEFYVQVLGLELVSNWGNEFAQIKAPGVIIALHPAPDDSPRTRGDNLSIGLGVDDLKASMTALENKGVRFTRVVEDRPVKLAFFADPDGNPLYLSQTTGWK
ncbi:MAG: VOC family protein [Thaumarchaeota archaeon]|nr:VOC family protein [Nitrososphaerota archaeon]